MPHSDAHLHSGDVRISFALFVLCALFLERRMHLCCVMVITARYLEA